MWGFFSKDPIKDFGYEIGEIHDGPRSDYSLWSFHTARKKGTSDEYSAFVINAAPGQEYQFNAAKNGYKQLKSMRHPYILSFQDGVETDKSLYIVTEPVLPLRTYLTNNTLADFQLAWGIYQIAKAISFVNNSGQLIHNAVCSWNVFVTKSGDWKLAGMDFASPANSEFVCPRNLISSLEKYWPPGNTRNLDKWAIDAYGLGCLIWEAFNCPEILPSAQSLKDISRIPRNVHKQYRDLASLSGHANAQSFVDACRGIKGGFFDSYFFNSMLFIEEIQLKDNLERLRFLERLPSHLDQFPEDVQKFKLLPQLVSALDYAADSGPAILGPLVKIGKLLESTDYQSRVVPCIVKLFASPDRQTRVKLLAQMEDYAEHLTVQVVNDQIYPHLIMGFNDVNPVVREATVKSIACLAPKLSNRNLNEDILRHFSRLQSRDDQAGVRVNTTVCIGKVAPCLNPQTRQRVLAPALARGLRDPFSPARQASILALVATAQFYSLAETAGRVVPAICPLMADPDQAVRQQAFRAIKGFIEKLEKASQNPEIIPDLEKHVNSTASLVGGGLSESASSWAGWAFSSMTSLMTKVQKQQDSPKPDVRNDSALLEQQNSKTASQQPKPIKPESPKKAPSSETSSGWDDFDVSLEDNVEVSAPKIDQNRLAILNDTSDTLDDWGDDNWLPLDEPKIKPAKETKVESSSGWGDFENGGGWDDDTSFNNAINNKPKPLRSAAARRQQQQGSSSSGTKAGPLKLGAKKLT